jgi:hypothetical protein
LTVQLRPETGREVHGDVSFSAIMVGRATVAGSTHADATAEHGNAAPAHHGI